MTILQDIVAQRRLDVAESKNRVSLDNLAASIKQTEAELGGPISLIDRIHNEINDGMAIAAEFKRASPSKGVINADLDVSEQAKLYSGAGAAIISVLTEPKWFKGSLEDLLKVRKTVNHLGQEKRPALLRKDFIIDRYQIAEARAYGADTILLMLSILDKETCGDLIKCAREYGMEPLVEVVNETELEAALEVDARVIGVNNRDLHTFQLDMNKTVRLAEYLSKKDLLGKDKVTILALSGISSRADVLKYEACGCKGVLIGESLMRSPDPARAIQELVGKQAEEAVLPLIKMCGITDIDSALHAARLGADMIGLIFAEKSPRRVSPATAKDVASAVHRFSEREGRLQLDFSQISAGDINTWFNGCAGVIRAAKKPLVVGVFQNQTAEYINQIIAEVGLDLVQLHGNEEFEFSKQLDAPAIKVSHIPQSLSGARSAEEVVSQIKKGYSVAILLDTSVKDQQGGTGKTFDWSIASQIQDMGLPVIVAGGLRPENIAEAIKTSKPFGVDVSGGLETGGPGKKDVHKMSQFALNSRQVRSQSP